MGSPHPAHLQGSSPHTRGALHIFWLDGSVRRIIPAYAGSTRRRRGRSVAMPDHPRIRGEHQYFAAGTPARPGSSPHTRGARKKPPRDLLSGGIIPAYAGSTQTELANSTAAADHPRIRGEHYTVRDPRAPISGSSPHTRGAQAVLDETCKASRIIPAYAGSTASPVSTRVTARDHPRIRGEHLANAASITNPYGSSPHTRGARAFLGEGDMSGRIIPAYAGSTGRRAR